MASPTCLLDLHEAVVLIFIVRVQQYRILNLAPNEIVTFRLVHYQTRIVLECTIAMYVTYIAFEVNNQSSTSAENIILIFVGPGKTYKF